MTRSEAGAWVGLGAVTVVSVVHAVTVGQHYHVGSFDDDANYIMVARALAHGAGLTTRLPPGSALVAAYPPGYAALLAPLARIWGDSVTPFRVLSVILLALSYPLTWVWLRRRQVGVAVRVVACLLLALSPVVATYGTMVMAELPFIVLVLALLLLLDGWDSDRATRSWSSLGVVLVCAAMVWVKEAGIVVVAALLLWLVLRRLWAKAAVTAAGVGALIAPFVIARATLGTSLIGARYSEELGGPIAGGLLGRITHLPSSAWRLLDFAIPRTLVPPPTGFSFDRATIDVVNVAGVAISVLAVAGAVLWWRRYHDAVPLVVGGYLAGTLAYPFVNERRVILVVPVIVAFVALGAEAAWRRIGRPATVAVGVAVLVVLAAEFPRNYLLALNVDTSHPSGSSYMAMLSRLGRPGDLVETDYVWTTALYSGHDTGAAAFLAPCSPAAIQAGLAADNAAYLLSAALNEPGVVGSDCLLGYLSTAPTAVRLFRTDRDLASVFELIGPGSPNPAVEDLTSALAPGSDRPVTVSPEEPQSPSDQPGTFTAVNGDATLTWSWNTPEPVTQVSLGGVSGQVTGESVELRTPGGEWQPVVSGVEPFLIKQMPAFEATAARVVLRGQGALGVHDLHVLAIPR